MAGRWQNPGWPPAARHPPTVPGYDPAVPDDPVPKRAPARVPLPRGGPEAVAASLHRWVRSGPLHDVVHAFGGHCPAGGTAAALDWLDRFSARHWDFRAGLERPDAREPRLEPRVAELIVASARALGMIDPVPPPHRSYAHLLVLGGLAPACLRRTGYAAALLRAGLRISGEVALLGSFRPLSPAETRALADAGITGCRTEVDALDAAARLAFGRPELVAASGEDGADPHGGWATRGYLTRDGSRIRVLAAPSSEPAVRRAHTADTQRFWAGHAGLASADPLLLVTAPIYVPFQHCDALRTLGLPYGCHLDTIGVDPASRPAAALDEAVLAALPEPTLTPGRYLQEIRSTIRSMRALHATLAS